MNKFSRKTAHAVPNWQEEEEELYDKNPPTPCLWKAPASAQKTKSQKENQAGDSPERTVEGQGGRLAMGTQPVG